MWPLLWLSAFAQVSPGAVGGVVVNSSTGAPLARAVVTLQTTTAKPLDAVALTDANGAFLFTYVPAGRYRLWATLHGYESASYGSSSPNQPPGILVLHEGEMRKVILRLVRTAAISGIVLDQDGEPVPGAQITLLQRVYERRKPTYAARNAASTDNRGEYHMSGIGPGKYFMMAGQPFMPALRVQPEGADPQSLLDPVYGPQFYPSAGRIAAASPIVLPPGKEVTGIDFHLPFRPVVKLRGKVLLPEEVPPNTFVQIQFIPQDIPEPARVFLGGGAGPPKYEFEMNNLAAGQYLAVTMATMDGRPYRGVEAVEIAPGMSDVTLRMEPGIDLAGRLRVEGEAKAGTYRVQLVPGDGLPLAGIPPSSQVKPNGTFRLSGVVPGIWDIGVEPIPPGGYLKSMLLGDQDVLTEDMAIRPDTRAPLNIVVSTRGAQVEGTVAEGEGDKAAPHAAVVLAPTGKYEHVVSFYQASTTDDEGHFEMKGVTPGRYRLYAFRELDLNRIQEPGFLKPFEVYSEPLDVAEGSKTTKRLRLIPAGSTTP